MKNVYDNGSYLLGEVGQIIKESEKWILTSDNETQLKEIVEDLKEYYDKDEIVCIYYDNPMGYTIEYWTKDDTLNKESD